MRVQESVVVGDADGVQCEQCHLWTHSKKKKSPPGLFCAVDLFTLCAAKLFCLLEGRPPAIVRCRGDSCTVPWAGVGGCLCCGVYCPSRVFHSSAG